jgi:hypothetical protein
MSHPGSGPDMNPAGQQPGQQPGAWTPPGGATPAGAPTGKSGLRKALPIVGSLAVAGVLGASAFGMFGRSEPEVGDCVKGGGGGSEFESVDCGSDEAENRVVGIEEEQMTYDEFMAEKVCTAFENAMSAIWFGPADDDGADGTVYCAEPV